MRILFFGDIVGKLGRRALATVIPEARESLQPDAIIVNGENLAHGMGITRKTLTEILTLGIDAVTSGNHISDKDEFTAILTERESRVIRPANYPPGVPGSGMCTIPVGSRTLTVINLMGRVFMSENLDCPFRTLDTLLQSAEVKQSNAIIVDFHAEATSEKTALGWYADGRVSALLGTHTHIPTADARILTDGTAYVTDVGMVGGRDGVIGVERQGPLKGFLTQLSTKFEVLESGVAQINAVLIDIDPASRRATAITRFDREISIV
ncbi:MAG: TIGR00282 family metallophosphoesterase [Patescibacteria group bacterium]